MTETKINNILITGDRGQGKTYLVKRVIENLYNVRMAGFFTQKERDEKVTMKVWDNFCLYSNGPKLTVYDPVDNTVRENVFDEIGAWALKHALNNGELIICDELGRLELNCSNFINAVEEILDENKPVLAVVKNESNPFLDSLRSRKDVELYDLNRENRDLVYKYVIKKLESFVKKSSRIV